MEIHPEWPFLAILLSLPNPVWFYSSKEVSAHFVSRWLSCWHVQLQLLAFWF